MLGAICGGPGVDKQLELVVKLSVYQKQTGCSATSLVALALIPLAESTCGLCGAVYEKDVPDPGGQTVKVAGSDRDEHHIIRENNRSATKTICEIRVSYRNNWFLTMQEFARFTKANGI